MVTSFAWLFVTLSGPVLYLALLGDPDVRATGWPAFVLLALGTVGLGRQALKTGRRLPRALGVLSLSVAAVFVWGFFVAARLPEAPAFDALEMAPGFDLEDAAGVRHALAEATASGPVLLVFFRGRW